jgi:hypothetical protein
MTPQLIAIALSTITQFIVGAIWYTPLFGKLWGEIHGFDTLSKKAQKEMMSKMGPIFGVQLVVTIVTAMVLVILNTMLPAYSLYMITMWIWLGFVVPSQVSGILFSGLDEKWMLTKSAVMAGGSFVSLMSGAAAITFLLG